MLGIISDNTCHTHRSLQDMGKMLDLYCELVLKENWKVAKIKYGPGLYQLLCLHPDTARIILKSGTGIDFCNKIYF